MTDAERLVELRTMLAARADRPGYKVNTEKLRDEIARLQAKENLRGDAA